MARTAASSSCRRAAPPSLCALGRTGWLLGLALLAAATAGAEPSALLVGAAAVEIAPPAEVSLAGYGARGPGNRAQGVLEPVSARALVLADPDGTRVGLVVVDALIVTPDLRRAVTGGAAELGLDALVVAATHTHSGPGAYKDDRVAELAILGWYRPESREALIDAALSALQRAAEQLRPAGLAAGQAEARDLARNRRHEGGPQDPLVPVLRVDGADGAPIATLFALAAHPTVLSPANLRLSPDYPGAARRRVEARRGGVALFLAGPLGDQKPHFPGEPRWPEDVTRQVETARLLGEALGDRVLRAARAAQPDPAARVTAIHHNLELPPVDVRASCVGYVGAPLLHVVARRFLPESTPLVALRLGELRLLASPFELGVEVAAAIRAGSFRPGPLLIAAHANDWLGYLLMPEDWDRGGYEPCLAYHGRNLAPSFIDAAAELLAELP